MGDHQFDDGSEPDYENCLLFLQLKQFCTFQSIIKGVYLNKCHDKTKALTALVGRLPLSVWENGPERGLFRLTLMAENNITLFSSGEHFVHRSITSLAILLRVLLKETFL